MFNQKAFTFSADCKALEQTIKKVLAVVGSAPQTFLGAYKSSLCVFGMGQDSFAMISVPNSSTSAENSLFGFDSTILPGLIKGRAVMDFSFSGSSCEYKQVKGRYSGKINALEVSEDQMSQIASKVVPDKKSKVTTLTSEQLTAIRGSITLASVKDVYQNTTLMSYIVLSQDGKLQVSSFDAQHFGLIRAAVGESDPLRVALPQTHFSLVEQVAAGSDAKFSITASGLRATGKGFVLNLPTTQAKEEHFGMVATFLKSLDKAVLECECSVEKLYTVAENIFTLYNANANFAVKIKGDVLSLGLSTAAGSAQDAVKVKGGGEAKFEVDPRLFMDILSLAKVCKTVTLKVTAKVIVLTGKVKDSTLYLACART